MWISFKWFKIILVYIPIWNRSDALRLGGKFLYLKPPLALFRMWYTHLTTRDWICIRNKKNVFWIISCHWDDPGNWDLSACKISICLSTKASAIVADDLVKPVEKKSPDMVSALISWNVPVSAQGCLICGWCSEITVNEAINICLVLKQCH